VRHVEYIMGVTEEQFNAIVARRIAVTPPDDPLDTEFRKLEAEVAARSARERCARGEHSSVQIVTFDHFKARCVDCGQLYDPNV